MTSTRSPSSSGLNGKAEKRKDSGCLHPLIYHQYVTGDYDRRASPTVAPGPRSADPRRRKAPPTSPTHVPRRRCLATSRRAVEVSNGREPYPLRARGLALRQRGDARGSLEALRAAAAGAPGDGAEAARQVARALHLAGRHDEATQLYESAIAAGEAAGSPPDWAAWHQLGLVRAAAGDRVGALAALQRAKAASPHQDSTRLALARLAMAPVVRSGPAGAPPTSPSGPGAAVTSAGANAAAAAAPDLAAAARELDDLLRTSPRHVRALTERASLHLAEAERGAEPSRETALVLLARALLEDPADTTAALAASAALLADGDADGALAQLRCAAAAEPAHAQVWTNVGVALLQKRRVVPALACLGRALSLDPWCARARHNLGVALLIAGRPATALHALTAAAQGLGGGRGAGARGSGPTLAALGCALAMLDDGTAAAQALERSLAADPTDHRARLNLAITLAKLGRREEASAQVAQVPPDATCDEGKSGGLAATRRALVAALGAPG